MPELPDLANYAVNLNKLLEGKTIRGYRVFNQASVFGDVAMFSKLTVNSPCSVFRYGKELFLEAANQTLSIHLMLDGTLYFEKNADNVKYKLFSVDFDDTSLFVTDFKPLARVRLFDVPDFSVPDAISQDFSYDYFSKKLFSTRKTVKALLLDQNFVKGIGNAYADEILWQGKVHPESVCNKIPMAAAEKLYTSISDTLTKAISSISSIAPITIRGEERSFLSVHNPARRLSPSGFPIHFSTVCLKRTYFTEEQTLYR